MKAQRIYTKIDENQKLQPYEFFITTQHYEYIKKFIKDSTVETLEERNLYI